MVYATKIEVQSTSIARDDLPTEYEDILIVCSNLVKIVDNTLEFFHSSVKDFLLSNELEEGTPAHIVFGNATMAHRDIATICLTYLMFDCFKKPSVDEEMYTFLQTQATEELSKSLQAYSDKSIKKPFERTEVRARSGNLGVDGGALRNQYPFLSYASQYWSGHLVEVGQKTDSADLTTLVAQFLRSTALSTWIASCSVFHSEEPISPSEWFLSVIRVGEDLQQMSFTEQTDFGMILLLFKIHSHICPQTI